MASDHRHVLGLQAFLSLDHAELDLLAFLQRAVPLTTNLLEMDEHVITAATLEKTLREKCRGEA